jgi:hypothetical protein
MWTAGRPLARGPVPPTGGPRADPRVTARGPESPGTIAASPPVSVRSTSVPEWLRARIVIGFGWPYRLPAPTLTTAIRGRTAANSSGVV